MLEAFRAFQRVVRRSQRFRLFVICNIIFKVNNLIEKRIKPASCTILSKAILFVWDVPSDYTIGLLFKATIGQSSLFIWNDFNSILICVFFRNHFNEITGLLDWKAAVNLF